MSPNNTFTDKTRGLPTGSILPAGQYHHVQNHTTIVLGHDLHLCVQRVRVEEPAPAGGTISIRNAGWTVELFDSDGNHLMTVLTKHGDTFAIWEVIPSLITTILSWEWTKDFTVGATFGAIKSKVP